MISTSGKNSVTSMRHFIVTISLAALAACGTTPDTEPKEAVAAADAAVQEVTEPAALDDAAEVSATNMDYYCTPQENLTPLCGFKSPEDAEWLPDGSGMLVSEYGKYEFEGTIKLVNHETGDASVLWDASKQTAGAGVNVWGAEGVTQKAKFSPHGISLSQREDGAWQLLVVNHAETETIDFFELVEAGGAWTLEWRGGVDADGLDFYNDVAADGNGFFTTRFFLEKRDNLIIDYTEKLENGIVKKWSPKAGWVALEGTRGLILNGILWNATTDELVVNEWGNGRVNIFSAAGEKKFTIEDIPHPDNVSWNDARDAYLVASKSVAPLKLVECEIAGLEVCEGPFHIYEIEPESGQKTVRYESDGKFWGPPSNAIEKDGKLYIGSFGGTRILVAE